MFPCCPQIIGIDSHSDLAHWYSSPSISISVHLAFFCHLMTEMFASSLQVAFYVNFRWNSKTMQDVNTHSTHLKAFNVHMPRCLFQRSVNFIFLRRLYELPWFISHLLSDFYFSTLCPLVGAWADHRSLWRNCSLSRMFSFTHRCHSEIHICHFFPQYWSVRKGP